MLSTTKVAAGGLAAATAAVLASYFGVLGTVGAAAATSVVTAVSAEIYQRSLDRGADRLRGRGNGRYERGQEAPTTRRPPPARRPVLSSMVFGSLVIFALGIGLVSGIEYARGAPLSGGSSGTSIGEVLHGTLPPAVGNLLGPGRQPDNSADEGRQGDRRRPGLIGDLLSGL